MIGPMSKQQLKAPAVSSDSALIGGVRIGKGVKKTAYRYKKILEMDIGVYIANA